MRRFKIEFEGPNGGTESNIFDKYEKFIIEEWINDYEIKGHSQFRKFISPKNIDCKTIKEEELEQWIKDTQEFLKQGYNLKYGIK
jgi:hypothetical protein